MTPGPAGEAALKRLEKMAAATEREERHNGSAPPTPAVTRLPP